MSNHVISEGTLTAEDIRMIGKAKIELMSRLGDPSRMGGMRFFKKKNRSTMRYEIHERYGMDTAVRVSEDETPPLSAGRKGYGRSVTMFHYGRTRKITKLAMDLYPEELTRAKAELEESYSRSIERFLYAWWSNAIEGATILEDRGLDHVDNLAMDGLSYFNDAHTWRDDPYGVANSNLSATTRTMTYANVVSMRAQRSTWVDWNGDPMMDNIREKRLVVADDIETATRALFEAKGRPTDDSNAVSELKQIQTGSTLNNIEVWRYLPNGEFFIENELPSDRDGVVVSFLSGYEKMPINFTQENKEAQIFGYKYTMGVNGYDWCQFITSRAPIA